MTDAPRAVVVTGQSSAIKNGYTERVKQNMLACDLSFYSEISPEPMQEEADRLKGHLVAQEPDIVIALGGGSVIDVTKIACSAAASGALPRDSAADLLVLSADPTPIDPAVLWNVTVDLTVVAGQIAYQRATR